MIIHLDLDAFFASVEQLDDPSLRGRPVIVGGTSGRGVVCAASYEARRFGVHSAMPIAWARQRCPEGVFLPPRFDRYVELSDRVFGIYRRYTPLVEPLSQDEAYLDVTHNTWKEPLGTSVARRLKTLIRERTGLTASAGVAPNKFLSKIASGWQKPDGLTVIAPARVESFLQRLPVDALWGVGPVTARRLRGLGIERLVDVRTADADALQLQRWWVPAQRSALLRPTGVLSFRCFLAEERYPAPTVPTPVPAPATLAILQESGLDVVIGKEADGELCTPTGAALLSEFFTRIKLPDRGFSVIATGYGAGSRNLPDIPNVLRAFLAETKEPEAGDLIDLLETNVDDVNGEIIAHATSVLIREGAYVSAPSPVP